MRAQGALGRGVVNGLAGSLLRASLGALYATFGMLPLSPGQGTVMQGSLGDPVALALELEQIPP